MKQLGWTTTGNRPQRGRAFTLTDVLVSLGVMMLLVGLMLPALGSVRSAAQQVVCGSNLRQIGMGLIIYADSNRDQLPPSLMAGSIDLADVVPPQNSTALHTSMGNSIALRFDIGVGDNGWWDGLGALYNAGVLETPELFYCPSHDGPHAYRDNALAWKAERDLIVGNYQYRGASAEGITKFSLVQPSRTALVSDSFRSRGELNHDNGFYMLRADLSINWLADSAQQLLQTIPDELDPISESTIGDILASSHVDEAIYRDYWQTLQNWDDTGRHEKPNGPTGPGGNGKP